MGILLSLFRETLFNLPQDCILACKPVWLKLCQGKRFKEKYLQNEFSSYWSSEHQGKSSFWRWLVVFLTIIPHFAYKGNFSGRGLSWVWLEFGGLGPDTPSRKVEGGRGWVEMTALCVFSIVSRTLLSSIPPQCGQGWFGESYVLLPQTGLTLPTPAPQPSFLSSSNTSWLHTYPDTVLAD